MLNAYLPDDRQTEDSPVSDESWDLACAEFNTNSPTQAQLDKADEILIMAWERWEDYETDSN